MPYIDQTLRDNWKTPQWLYDQLDAEFNFDFDPCPPHPTFDGLTIEWGQRNYVNPPYGRPIPQWLAKATEEQHRGKLSVFLVPSRTDTRWWHTYCITNEVRFIKGRLKFDDQTNPAPFASALVILRPNAQTHK
jgi:hypothetical protein